MSTEPIDRDAQRIIDALTDLFDATPPADRTAAEEELREAGIDSAAAAERATALAASRLRTAQPSGHAAKSARPGGTWRDDTQRRGRVAPVRPDRPPRPRRSRLLYAAGVLAAGVAGGFALARLLPSADRVPAGRSIDVAHEKPFKLPRRAAESPPAGLPDQNVAAPPAARAPAPSAANPSEEGSSAGWPAREAAPDAATVPQSGTSEQDEVPSADTRAAVGDGKSWILDSSNWEEAAERLPPAVLERVKRGDYWFTVVTVDPERLKQNYSVSFWQASEGNHGKYEIDAETCGLKDPATGRMPDFYFGYPFPVIDPNDPLAACKIAWNVDAASAMGEGHGSTLTLNGIEASGEFKRVKLWLHGMSYLGRHGGPIDNPERLRWTSVSNVWEPHDVAAGGLTQRPNDWESEDRIWSYVPATRRVRRVAAANRSDTMAGLDIYADDLNCDGGKIEYSKWKLVGEQIVLAPVLSPTTLAQAKTSSPSRYDVAVPYPRAVYETPDAKGIPWLVVDNLVLVERPVWVVEAKPSDRYSLFGKVVMYVDKELYRVYWKMVHNQAGEYFYNAMCAYNFSKSEDGSFTAVTPGLVLGVNDKTNRACLAGRSSTQFIERAFPADYFSLRTLTHVSD